MSTTTTTTTPTKELTQKEIAANKIASRKESLLKLLGDNRNIYTSVLKVSPSGMSRHIKCFIAKDNQIINITWYVADILGYKINRDSGGLVVGGCGMDMGFSVVYSIGRSLYPNGFTLQDGHYGRNGDKSGFDTDGGYYFNQQWI